ncbi:TPR repeat-containing protein (plasmid) [Prosthecochloris aestuarii DSM 271]|uniref:TPR repeat-containing protein n=1 Tax=Prosthecochloris aestuarii (strain DSM 271 / SK 413) TaxID=290512 RepID=B4S9P4_PROA2|nr:FxSxx-COOH system tetratricopeptide repeat protein [Prosthecochloris aestuarii]ACF47371.1 TPR repeat-containing protein [Prosthecochloris aestuarii DSM 271]
MDQEKKDFFISYTGADQQWAEWIAWQLEKAGYTTVLQAWDFHAGSNFVQDMQTALEKVQRTIAVLSPRYLQSAYARAEWSAVFAEDPTGEKGILIPVRIEPCELKGLHKAIVYIDLVRKERKNAQAFLLKELQHVLEKSSRKPKQEPGYPGEFKPEPRYPGSLPDVWNIPRRNPNFTGRDQLLQDLHASLTDGNHTALTQQALHGLGGIGKSQLAIEYAYRYSTSYAHAWWIRAEEDASIITDYAALATALQLPEKDAEEQKVIIEAVRRWLNTHHGWLLVFDNVRDAASIRHYLPDGTGGHVLITSRNPDWRTIGRPLQVTVWERDESIAFLKQRTGQDQQENSDANELADELGDLPLALEQAAAFIEKRHITISEYLNLYRTRRKDLLDRTTPSDDYPDTIATTWVMAFEAIRDVPLASDLLFFSSIIAPDAIPKDLIKQALEQRVDDQDHEEQSIDELDFHDAIDALCSYSLISPDTDTFSIHRLVQAITQDRMGPEAIAHYRKEMLQSLLALFPEDAHNTPSCWRLCAELLPHAEKIIEKSDPSVNMATLLNNMGSYYHGRAFYAEAEPLYRRALDIYEKQLGGEHPYVATSLNNLAELFRAQGKYGEAEPLYRRALGIDEKALGLEHPEVATDLNNLALLLDAQGKYGEAEPLYRRALDIYEKQLGGEHPYVATSLNNLAGLLYAQGKYGEAEPLYRRALLIREEQLGGEHPYVATSLNNLAGLLDAQGKYGEAEPLYRRALGICEQSLGASHPNTITMQNNLEVLLEKMKDSGDREKKS